MTDPLVTLQPLLHVEDLAAAVALYEALGARVVPGDRGGDFALLELAGSRFSLLAHPPNPEQDASAVELTLGTDDLDRVAAALRAAGIGPASAIVERDFGRQLAVEVPGAPLVKITELAGGPDA